MEEQSDAQSVEGLAPTEWENPPELKALKEDLNGAHGSHSSQVAKIERWLDALHVRGAAKPKERKNRSSIQPKLIRKQAEWRYPSLTEPFLSTESMFDVDPVTWEDANGAHQNKLLLNNQMATKIDKVAFIDEFVRAAVDGGTAIVRTGWVTHEVEEEVNKPIWDFRPNPMLQPLHEELAAMKLENPTGYRFEVPEGLQKAHELSAKSGTFMEPVRTGTVTVTETKTTKNCPTLTLCDYNDVVLDPSCEGDVDKAKFVVYKFETSLSDLREQGIYENLDEINVENASPLGAPDHAEENPTDFNFSDQARKKFVAYEYWGYWDFDGDGIARPIVATWVGNVLIRLEENPYPDGKIPFVFVPLLPVKGSAYGEPDGELIEDNQKILGALTRGFVDIMARSANAQTGMRKDMLDGVNRRKFQQGMDYEFNAGVDPRQGVHMHVFNDIPASAWNLFQQQSIESESMTGVKAFSQGIDSGSLGDVAAGIRGALDAASKRETSILRRLASGMEKIGRKMIAMNGEFLNEEEVVRITNGEFVPIRRDDLAGNYDLKLSISTAEEDNVKAQELAFMLQTIGPNTDHGMIKLILRDIARLRKMPELAHQIEQWEPQPDPLDQQLKQLEAKKLEAEIAKIESESMENMTDAQLNEAKARLTNSQADQSDLDFVEQESGTKQEREKELHGEQARANMNLKAMDHQEKRRTEKNAELDKYLAATG